MINEILVKLPSQLFIYNITTSFDKNFDLLSMNRRIELSKFEPEPTFEQTIDNIKNNHLKSITSSATNLSAIAYFDKHFDLLSMNNIFEAAELNPEPAFENTINMIKSNHLKSIIYIAINVSYSTRNKPSSSSEHL